MYVTDRQIKELDKLQLTKLAHHLLLNEARAYQIPLNSIECSFNIDTGDGGEDLSIRWDGLVDRTNYLESRDTLIQVKAKSMPASECENELLTTERELKLKLKELFSRGGTYILFCNTDARSDRVGAMKAVAKSHGFPKASILSYSPTKIMTWVNEYFPVIAYVNKESGKQLPIALHTWLTWSKYEPHRDSSFTTEKILQDYITELRETAIKPNNVFRICGLSGLGKSRLIIEAFSEPALRRMTSFIDGSNNPGEIAAQVSSWLNTGMSGTLIVDNCSFELHSKLAAIAQHPDSRFSLVTSYFDPEEVPNNQRYIELKPLIPETIEGIIRKKYPDLPDSDVSYIVEFAEGFPQMAVLMCQADLREAGSLSKLTPLGLVNKLLFPTGTVDETARNVISACALFDKFAFDDGEAKDTALIAKRLCGMEAKDFCQIAMQFKRRNILEPHMGSFTKVTPRPLAWRLASEWWESCSKTLGDLLIDSEWPLSLAEAMCNQLTFLSDIPAAHAVAEKLCSPNCPFASAESLNSSRGSRLFCSLVEVNPEAALACLERAFLDMSKDQLQNVIKGRRYLIWSLEKLCWRAECFERAAYLLALFAEAENENRISNNATGQLKKLFHIKLPGTQANLSQRLNLIDEMSKRSGLSELVVDCLSAGFFYGSFNRIGGMVEVQGGKIAEQDYTPSEPEIKFYWQEILNRLLPKLIEEDLRRKVLSRLSSMFLYLIRFGYIDLLSQIINAVKKSNLPFWVEGLEKLAFAFKEESSKRSSEEIEQIKALTELLQPQSFEERYRLIVQQPSFSNIERDEKGEFILQNSIRAENFGEECGKTWPAWSNQLSLVLRGEQREGPSFAIGLYKSLGISQSFIDAGVEFLVNYKDHGNPVVLGEYIRNLKSSAPTIVETFIETVEQRSALHQYAGWFITRIGINDAALDRLLHLVQSDKIPLSQLHILKFGGVLKSVHPNKIEFFLREILKYKGPSEEKNHLVLQLLHMYVFQNEEYWLALESFAREFLMQDGLLVSLDEMLLYDWEQCVSRIFRRGNDSDFAQAIAREIVSVCRDEQQSRIYDFDRVLQPVLAELLKNQFTASWPVFDVALNSDEANLNYNLILLLTSMVENLIQSTPQPILAAPTGELAEWLIGNQKAMLRLARHIKLWVLDENRVSLNDLGMRLIDEVAENKRFLDILASNLASVGGEGSLRPQYEAREALMSQLVSHKNLAVQRWAAHQRTYYQKKIKSAKKREEEMKHGIFARGIIEDL